MEMAQKEGKRELDEWTKKAYGGDGGHATWSGGRLQDEW